MSGGSAPRASLFSQLANVNSVVLGDLLLGEHLSPLQIIGGAVVIASLVVASLQTK